MRKALIRALAGFVVLPTAVASDGPYADLDWVAREQLPAAEREVLPAYCSGSYVQPAFPAPLNSDPEDFPAVVGADDAQYWVDDRVEFTGDVHIDKGNQLVRAPQATIHLHNEVAEMPEGVTYRVPGLLLRGATATTRVDTGAAEVTESRFVMHDNHLRGRASEIARDKNGTLRVTDGSVTRCEPGSNSWSLNSREIVIKEGAQHGKARNATLKVGRVPVFWAPRMTFPVSDERVSGFLFPDIGYGDTNGLDVALPYYLNLAPNYDATLTPRYISERGLMGEAEFRHLSRWSNTEIGGGYMPEDDLYDGKLSKDDWKALGSPGEFEPSDRWIASIDHAGWLGNFRTLTDLAWVSDDDYLRDLGTNLAVSSQVELESTAAVEYRNGGLHARAWTQTFRRLEAGTDPYDRIPGVDLSYERRLLGPLRGSLGVSYADFDRSEDLLLGTIEGIKGNRTHVEPRLLIPLNWPFGFFHLEGGWRYTSYDLEDVPVGVDDAPERNIGLGSLDGGLYFERETSVFGSAVVQTLEPRLYYLYQEHENQDDLPRFDATNLTFGINQLFRDNRFSGLDRIGDANQLSTVLTTRFVSAETGRELLQASLGQIFYFRDRKVTLSGIETSAERQSSSAIVFEAGSQLARYWHLRTNVVWDPHDNEFDETGFALQYRRDNRHIANIGWRSLDGEADDDLNQTDVSAYWPVSTHWAVMARWNYDVDNEETLEVFGGVEYNTCCWQVRFMGRQFLKNQSSAINNIEKDKGVFLQLVFRGLAGFGGRVDQVMRNGIRGYSTRANQR